MVDVRRAITDAVSKLVSPKLAPKVAEAVLTALEAADPSLSECHLNRIVDGQDTVCDGYCHYDD